ncbi:toxin-antitoxin system HicB family antitoxin [Nocardiopsis sp. NPDC058631]|uniref:toxin-antitoxin system HicB family antitoxin n=1 Tax=Nocardiopsis sp. NPDC058631 TaxID=3346566 RepID=UPI0036467749
MELTPYVDNLRNELATAADAGGDEARALAERLTAPLDAAARLTLLHALSDAMAEVTRDLAPGSVEVRLRGLDPEFVVTPPQDHEPPEEGEPVPSAARAPAPPVVADDDGAPARINLRLPAHLKARAETAAGQEGLSVNAWLVRALATALEPGDRPEQPVALRRSGGRQGFTGWVR